MNNAQPLQDRLTRRIRYFFGAVWLLFAIWVLASVLMLIYVPGCQLGETPSATGCVLYGVDYSGWITMLVFFNIFWLIGIFAVQEIVIMLMTALSRLWRLAMR